jgi:GDP-L-fucose synthase
MILITGGTGFVGTHIKDGLRSRGLACVALGRGDADLSRPDAAQSAFAAYPDTSIIVHAAAYQGGGGFLAGNAAEQLRVNSLLHLNVLEAWRRQLPHARLFAIGSSCAYPPGPVPLKEDRYMDGALHESVSTYALTKRLLYQGLAAYRTQYGLGGTFLIPATMFGEGDDFAPETGHVCGALIGKFVRAVHDGLPEVEVWGDGSQVRDFMYVGDFVKVLLDLLPVCSGDVLNVGPGRGTSIRELVGLIQRASGFAGRVRFAAERYVGVREKFVDPGRLYARYALSVRADLTDAIQQTVDWYFANFPLVQEQRRLENGTTRKFIEPGLPSCRSLLPGTKAGRDPHNGAHPAQECERA